MPNAREGRKSTAGFRRPGAATVVLVIGVALAILAFFWMRSRQQRAERFEFVDRAQKVGQAIQSNFEAPLEILHSIPALFDASREVSRLEFRRFVSRALARRKWIYAIEWFPYVPGSARAAHEAAARADGLTDFEFRDPTADGRMVRSPDRPLHIPLYYIEPPNDEVIGFDLTSRADRQRDIDRARDEGVAVAGSRSLLVEAPELGYFVAIYAPVYVPGRPLNALDERRAAIRGGACIALLIAPVVQEAIEGMDLEGLAFVLIDEDGLPDERLLYESRPGLGEAGDDGERLRHRQEFKLADRRWSLQFSTTAKPLWAAGPAAWAVLLGGIAMTGFAAFGLKSALLVLHLRGEVEAARELGHYTLGRPLGEGGMGIVFEARHRMLKRPAAIKLIRQRMMGGAEAAAETTRRRFEREAQVIASLTSPHTVQLYDFGVTDDGDFYYVMELLDGLDLGSLVRRFGPVPPERACALLRQACHSLEEAHSKGLVHRDIKPANVFACRRGNDHDVVKILDFGLVQEASRGRRPADVDQRRLPAGTPAFMAPEMALGEGIADARSDLYSLGCVAYWLVTGRQVFDGESSVAIMIRHVNEPPSPPSASAPVPVPGSFDRVVLDCLAKEPQRRPASAVELSHRLAEVAAEMNEWTGEDARAWWDANWPPRGA